MTLPRYAEYRASGIGWAAELPSHWGTGSLKWLSQRYSGGTPDKNRPEYWEDGTIPWLNSGAVNDGRIYDASAFITQQAFESSSAKWIPPGALVIALAGQGKTKGMVAQVMFKTTCNQSMAAIVPADRIDSRWLYWWLVCNYQNIRNMAGGDLRDGLNLDLLGSIPCPLPSLREQTAIAAFLDRETAKIDALIAEQEKLIALLAEKRQATISHAVTRGLDPDAPMKDSGVEWLGEVPSHWDVKKICYVVDDIRDIDHYMPESVEDGVPYLMTGDLRDFVSEVSLEDCKQVSRDDYSALSKRIKSSKGDVIMARYATIGTSMYVDIDVDFLVSYSCVTLKTNDSKVSGLYLFQCMKSRGFRLGVENQVNTNTQGNVGIKDLRNVKIVVPPIDEQAAIAAYLDSEISKFDVLEAESERAITLLKERRSALIAAAVTGQIDVRAAVHA